MHVCGYGANDEVKFFDEVAERYVPYHCSQEALSGQDVCLFHYHEEKDRDNEKINRTFIELLKDASNQNKRFLGIGFKLRNFHFPKEIKTKVHFEHAVLSDVNFEGVHFNEDAVFSYSQMSDVSFYNSTFEKKAYFIYTKFQGKVYFRDAKFHDESNFNGAEFNSEANFQSAYFGDKAERLYVSLSETRLEDKIGPLSPNFSNDYI